MLPALIYAFFLLPTLARAAPPPAPPVSVAALGVSSISWTWSSSSTAGGYRLLSSTGGGNISGDLAGTATGFVLTGLSTNTPTTLTVEAFNVDGTSDAPPATAFTLAAAPSGTQLLSLATGQAQLSWQANGNFSTTTYRVDSWAVGGSTIVFSTQSANVTLVNFPSGTTVYFAVQAVNGDGRATPFDVAVGTFIPAAPAVPSLSTTTAALGVSSITWVWNGVPNATGYRLYTTSDVPVSPVLDPAAFSFVETGLSTNTAYSRYVQALSTAAATSSLPLTRSTLPAPTTGLALLGLSGTSETVSWGANSNPAGASYSLLWWTAATSTHTIVTQTTTATITNLYPGSTLYFAVEGLNGDGLVSSFLGVAPSTYIASAAQGAAPGSAQSVYFVIPTGLVTVEIGSQTFSTPVTVTVQTPAPGSIPALDAGLTALPSPIYLQVTAVDGTGRTVQPTRPLWITVPYGSAIGALAPTSLSLARYDVSHQAWVPLPTGRDPVNGRVVGLTDHLSLFSVLGVAAGTDLGSVSIGPNPLRPVVNPDQVMTFRRLPAGARVRLYTYVGELVADMTADGAGLAAWNGRNRSGSWVASGIYIALIEGGNAKATRRVAVER